MYSISLCVPTIILGICVVIINTSDLNAADTYCEGTGWEPYRDEKCLKLIKRLATRNEASELCAQKLIQSDSSNPQLVSIKSAQEQNYLADFLFDTSEVEVNVWIGLTRKEEANNKFFWDDGSEVEYANWDQGSPTEESRRGCVEMQSEFTRKFSNSSVNSKLLSNKGKWRDVTCSQGNYVICQKMQRWSFGKLQQTLLDTRKQLVDSNEALSMELGDTKSQLLSTQNELNNLKQSLIPIGFIYTQLPSDKAPNEIWPWMTWTDVSSTYEGVFFRVTGGEAAPFGQVQDDNAPRVTKVAVEYLTVGSSGEKDLLINSWSEPVYIGDYSSARLYTLFMKFFTSDGEVRPKNMAIRVWKRTG